MTHNSSQQTRRRRWRGLVASVLAASVVLVGGPAVLAQDDEPIVDPSVHLVDARGPLNAVVHTGDRTVPEVAATVNGQAADSVAANLAWRDGYSHDVVIVIDDSEKNADSLDEMKTAATNFARGLTNNERIAVVTTGGAAIVHVPFSNDPAFLTEEISAIEANGAFRLWDGLSVAVDQLERGSGDGVLDSVIIFAAGADEFSDASYTVQRGRLLNLNALVHVVGVNLRDLPVSSLNELVAQNGGTVHLSPTTEELVDTAAAVNGGARGLHSVRITSAAQDDGTNLDLTVNGEELSVGYVPNSVATQGALERGEAAGDGAGIGIFNGTRGLLLGIVLGAMAIGLAVLAIGLLFNQDENALTSMLSTYHDPDSPGDDGNGLANNAIFQRAVELTEQIAEKQGVLARTEERLEQANLPFRAAEALTFYVATVIVSVLLAVLLRSNLLLAALIVIAGVALPHVIVSFMGSRRRKKFVSQLPDTLTLLAGTLKAGYSFMQGLETVSKESEDPIGEELRRVVTEAQLGRPVEDALDSSAERMNSDDYTWAIMAVKIQREVGGNLSELLMTVAETMTARERLRRDVAALTAEGRISAIVLGLLPIGLGAVMFMINPEYVGLLFSETLGRIMLIAGVVAALIGFAWMKKIITIEI